jgi:hypothetical protein
MRGVSCAAVVGGNDSVSCFGEGGDYMSQLVGGVGVSVDEKDYAFLCPALGWTVDVVDPGFSSFVYEDMTVLPLFIVNVCWVEGWHIVLSQDSRQTEETTEGIAPVLERLPRSPMAFQVSACSR